MQSRRHSDLLWMDCTAGFLSGLAVLLLGSFIVKYHNWPQWFVVTHVIASFTYASFSFSLARRQRRPSSVIMLLIVANLAWAALCGLLSIIWRTSLSGTGISHLLLEMIFVSLLALAEWKERDRLRTRE